MNNSCSGTKSIKNETIENQSINNLTPIFQVSVKTKLLINEIKTELSTKKTNLDNFVPSKQLIETYSLMKIDGLIYISGFIQINENFQQSTLDEISVKTGMPSGKILTIHIPINNFDSFLKNEGIEYFQLTEKTKTN